MKSFLNALEVSTALLIIAALLYGIVAADRYTRVASLRNHFMEECRKEVSERGDRTSSQVEFFCYKAIYLGN